MLLIDSREDSRLSRNVEAIFTNTKKPHKKIWLDPGIGFGKNLDQNLKILKKINKF